MPAARNLYMLPTTNQSIYSTPLDKDDRMYRSITTRHYPPSPPNTSQPSTPLMTSATPSVSSSRRTSLQGKPYSYYNSSIHTPSRSMSASTASSIPSPKMSKHDQVSNGNSSPFFNLEKVVQQYGEQRDLLELILSSKVEEDRRRAEEAKLRQKEIDYLLQQHRYDSDNTIPESGQQQHIRVSRTNSMAHRSSIDKSTHSCEITDDNTSRRFSETTGLSIDNNNSNHGSILPRIRSSQLHQSVNQDSAAGNSAELTENWRNFSTSDQQLRRQQQQSQEHHKGRRKSTNNIDSLLSHSPKPVSTILPPISTPTNTSSTTSPTISFNIPSINHVTSPREDNTNRSTASSDFALSPVDTDGDTSMPHTTERYQPGHPYQIEPRQVYQPLFPPFPPPDKLPILPATSRRIQRPIARRRRRREMQAISTIIETREFPYNDDYLWKNNGNTVHKKSGYRSIYYKCSNSGKGCPVNKTVTFKEHGNYLIKYRGEHLDECNRIKRIVDV
ncbi:hypothetical protein BDC45DRAFT_574722 [Circinella umbellata]|nr:hypothetical protein BDC45DRAFT_574722 [Circinella umbellata]